MNSSVAVTPGQLDVVRRLEEPVQALSDNAPKSRARITKINFFIRTFNDPEQGRTRPG